MTYSWALLIVVIVVLALYELGVFNPSYFAPRAQPGACHVYRPYGAGSAQDASLSGLCNNYIPQFVTNFNGANGYIAIGSSELPVTSTQFTFTISLWFSAATGGGVLVGEQQVKPLSIPVSNWWPALYLSSTGLLYGTIPGTDTVDVTYQTTNNKYTNAVLVESGTGAAQTDTLYINGQSQGSVTRANNGFSSANWQIGIGYTKSWPGGNGGWYPFNGQIANVQVTTCRYRQIL